MLAVLSCVFESTVTISDQGIPGQSRFSTIVDTILETNEFHCWVTSSLISLYTCHKDNTSVSITYYWKTCSVLVQVINNYRIRNLNKSVLVRSRKQQGTPQWMCSKTCNCKTLHCVPCYHISNLLIPPIVHHVPWVPLSSLLDTFPSAIKLLGIITPKAPKLA